MKKIKLLTAVVYACICTNNLCAQNIEWVSQTIAPEGEILQAIAKANEDTATIIGFGNTIVQTTDGGSTWRDLDIISNSDEFDYTDISFHNNVGYAVAAGAFKAVDRKSNDIIAHSPILKTIDGGLTWIVLPFNNIGDATLAELSPSAPGSYEVKFYCIECISEQVAYANACWKSIDNIKHNNLFKTEDGGQTWVALLTDRGSKYITSIKEIGNTIYVSGKETLYKLYTKNDSLIDLYPVIDKGEDDEMYFTNISFFGDDLFFPSFNDSIRYTSDGGLTFKTLPNIKKGYYVYKHNDSTYVVAGGKGYTQTTSDAGANWTLSPINESLWNGDIIGDSLIATGKNTIYKMALSDIDNKSFIWNQKTIPFSENNIKGICTMGDTAYLAAYGDELMISTDAGTTFTSINKPSKKEIIYASVDMSIISIAQGKNGASIISTRKHRVADYATGGPTDIYVPSVLWTTTNNWETWTTLDDSKVGAQYSEPSKNPYASGCYNQEFYSSECIDDSTFYISCQWYDTITTDNKITHGRIFKTIDAGASWDTITADLGSSFIKTIKFDGETGYIGGSNFLLKTTDGGATITDIYPALSADGDGTMYTNDINIVDENRLFITTTIDGVMLSEDAGATFRKLDVTQGGYVTTVIDDNSWITLGTESKCIFTNDAGSSWTGCQPSSTVYSGGVIMGDTLIALGKTVAYKLAISNLNTTSHVVPNTSENKMTIWQNNQELHLTSTENMQTCRLYNIAGQLINTYDVNATEYSLPTSNLIKGVYILTIKANDNTNSFKTIIR